MHKWQRDVKSCSPPYPLNICSKQTINFHFLEFYLTFEEEGSDEKQEFHIRILSEVTLPAAFSSFMVGDCFDHIELVLAVVLTQRWDQFICLTTTTSAIWHIIVYVR